MAVMEKRGDSGFALRVRQLKDLSVLGQAHCVPASDLPGLMGMCSLCDFEIRKLAAVNGLSDPD